MTDRPRGSIPITTLRVGHSDVGAATAMIDDDVLTFIVRVEHEERPMRLRFLAIDSAHLNGHEVTLTLRDGRQVSLVAPGAAELREEIIRRCQTVPELTRTLRAFGSRRGRRTLRESEAAEQQRFFGPFIEARRTASKDVSALSAIAAFEPSALGRAVEDTLREFALERFGTNAPARRALEAELFDLSEPLHEALQSLALAGAEAEAEPDDLRLWRAWSQQLRNTFEAADRAWMTLDLALDAAPLPR